MDVKKLWKYRHLTFLGIVLIFSLWIRTKTFSNEYVQTSADPWWFYRLTEDLIKNHYKPPEWDRLSHALPGRPGYPWMGLPYFTVLVHMILNLFGDYSLMYACNVVPLILVCLTGIFAYLLGKEFSNNWGGIATAVFILTSPTIVAISTAGYFETDIVTVLGTFACMFFLFLAFRKRSISSLILAVLSNILFVYSWNTGYYALFMFSGFVFFSILENLVQKKYMNAKSDVKFLLVITLPVFIISYLLGVNIFFYFFQRIKWMSGAQLVNISVAELQPLTLSQGGLKLISQRVGFFPLFLSVLVFPLMLVHKYFKSKKVSIEKREVFMLLWFLAMFFFTTRGIRFTLLLAIPAAVLGGYTIGSLIDFVDGQKEVVSAGVKGLVLLLLVFQLSNSTIHVKDMPPLETWVEAMEWLKKNADKDALIMTWWDPGHFITAKTNLRVHADGAHCPPGECIPYNHNDRIVDMGFIFSTDSEEDALERIKKYVKLKPEQIEEIKKKYPQVPEDALKPVTEVYLISSKDLIWKFQWMNYFGGYSHAEGFPGQCYIQPRNTWVWCPWAAPFESKTSNYIIYRSGNLELALLQEEGQIYPIMNRNFLIENMAIYDKERYVIINYAEKNTTLEKLPGMLWVSRDLSYVVYLPPEIMNSIFVRTFFFDGTNLEHFEKVFENEELKIYRVSV